MNNFINLISKYQSSKLFLNLDFKYGDLTSYVNDFSLFLNGERRLILNITCNSFDSLVGYFSFLNCNATQILIDHTDKEDYYSRIISEYKPNFIWCPKSLFPNAAVVIEFETYKLIQCSEYIHDIHDELKLLLTTSGSTGNFKLVKLSEYNLIENASSISKFLNINSNSRAITILPMSYSYGLSVINSFFYSGASIVLNDYSITQKEFWVLFNDYDVNHFYGVPYTYEIIDNFRLYNKFQGKRIQFTQAGGYLNKMVKEKIMNFCKGNNHEFIVMYGQTEATARMSYVPGNRLYDHIESIGVPIPNGQFTILDQSGNDITSTNKQGDLVYNGPNVMLGYSTNLSDLGTKEVTDETLHTGDIAYKTLDGFYYIVGRKKRFVKLFGNRVSLDELESICKVITNECVCIGKNDSILILVTNAKTTADLSEHILSKTLLQSRDFNIKVVDKMIRNSSGKILYTQMEALYGS